MCLKSSIRRYRPNANIKNEAGAAKQALVKDDVPDSQVKVREVSSVKTMATACRFVSRGNLVMFFTLLISVTCV